MNQKNITIDRCIEFLNKMKDVDDVSIKLCQKRDVGLVHHDFHPKSLEQISPLVTTIVIEDRR